MTAFSLLNLTSCNITIAAQCVNGDVRLIKPDTSDPDRVRGIVQLCVDGVWRTACRSDGNGGRWFRRWNTHAANLVCRQLGYNSEGQDIM